MAFNNLPLRLKLFVSFVIIGIIPMLLSGYLFFNKSYEVILDNSQKYTEEMLSQINNNLSVKIDNINSIALNIITNQPIKNLLNEKNDVLRGQNTREIESFLRNTVLSSKDISDIIIIDKNLNQYGAENGYLNESFNFKHSLYYQEMMRGNGNNVWLGLKENIIKTPYPLINRRVFPSVSVIKDFYINVYLGGLIINLNESAIMNIITNVYTGEEGNILILDRNKKYMVSTKPLNYTVKRNTFMKVSSKINRGWYVTKINGIKNLITYIQNDKTGWFIISAIPITDLVKTSGAIKDIISKTTFVFIVLCILFSVIISYSITKGINHLVNVMKQVRKGDFQIRLNTARKDEIGLLSDNFDNMIVQLNELIKTKFELELRESKAQLRVLQAQISPHFLYNALDSINWMLIENHQIEISKAVITLGNLLRYSISDKNEKSSVREEVEQVKNYLTIQKLRFEDRFIFTIDVAAEILDQAMPKFLLQPIVENAVIHGIEDHFDTGIIQLCGYQAAGYVYFEIRDNGAGIGEDELGALIAQINQEKRITDQENHDGHAHIGLENVNQRIKIIYGNEYGLEIRSCFKKGTTVIVKLPEKL